MGIFGGNLAATVAGRLHHLNGLQSEVVLSAKCNNRDNFLPCKAHHAYDSVRMPLQLKGQGAGHRAVKS